MSLPSPTSWSNGLGPFPAKLITAGSQTLTATDSVSSSITGTSGAIDVMAGTIHFIVSPSSPNAAVGQPISITVSAVDTCDVVQPSYTGTVHFTSTDLTASKPADYTFTVGGGQDNGVHTFTNGHTFHQAGTRTRR